MPTAEQLFPSFEVTLRDQQKFKFKTYAEFSEFWKRERASFRPILEGGNRAMQNNPAATALSQVNQKYQAIKAQINEATQHFNRYRGELSEKQQTELRARLETSAGNITSTLRSGFAPGPNGLWLSGEPAAQFVLELAKTDASEAAFAFLYLRRADFDHTPHEASRGTFKAQLFEANVTELRGNAETKAIALLSASWNADLDRMKSETDIERQTAKVLNEQHVKELEIQQKAAAEREKSFVQFIKERQEAHASQLKQAREELKKLADTYDEHMKLQAPVEYWKNKKLRHAAERRTLLFWTILVGLVSFGGLGAYVWFNFHESQAGVVPWREIVGFFVLSSLAFWSVKILVRLLLSAIHLSEDAAEREVMAMTYMALVRGDGSTTKYLEEKDRALVLGPLFRPSATGVIDDGAPPHVSEIIAKIGRR